LRAAAREDVVAVGVDRIRHETGGDRAAGAGHVRHVIEDLVPVVRGGRGTRRAQDPGGGVAVQLEHAGGNGVAAAGAAAGRPEDVQGDDGADGDRGAGTGREGGAAGRQ